MVGWKIVCVSWVPFDAIECFEEPFEWSSTRVRFAVGVESGIGATDIEFPGAVGLNLDSASCGEHEIVRSLFTGLRNRTTSMTVSRRIVSESALSSNASLGKKLREDLAFAELVLSKTFEMA